MLNRDGGTLTFDGATRPPYSLSTDAKCTAGTEKEIYRNVLILSAVVANYSITDIVNSHYFLIKT